MQEEMFSSAGTWFSILHLCQSILLHYRCFRGFGKDSYSSLYLIVKKMKISAVEIAS